MYSVEEYRVYVPGRDRDTGEERTYPVLVRQLRILAPSGLAPERDPFPARYRVHETRRRGQAARYTLSALPKVPQSIWDNPSGRPEAWYREGTEWVPQGRAVSAEELPALLRPLLGAKADAAARSLTGVCGV